MDDTKHLATDEDALEASREATTFGANAPSTWKRSRSDSSPARPVGVRAWGRFKCSYSATVKPASHWESNRTTSLHRRRSMAAPTHHGGSTVTKRDCALAIGVQDHVDRRRRTRGNWDATLGCVACGPHPDEEQSHLRVGDCFERPTRSPQMRRHKTGLTHTPPPT
jgi:hypothetical protein